MTMTNFLPHTDADREAMLAAIGVSSLDALFADVPASILKPLPTDVFPKRGLSEMELQAELAAYARENAAAGMANFLGGGAYHRFIPMAVNTIAGRSEFYTAYTPYQPEISQGTLQVGYEFQTMIAELTGMDVSNASVYDGASAVTEAALMALRLTNRSKILVASSMNPEYRQVLKTYLDSLGGAILHTVDLSDPQSLVAFDGQEPACVLVQQPNYFGSLEDVERIAGFCKANKALFIVSADPTSLGLLEAPGHYGADIVVGDIQPLGNNLSFGGPYGGYMACKTPYVRQLPGRLIGRTVEAERENQPSRPCYTLTLQTREQHIRREKATSNICTNQALNVLKATVYMTLVGPVGLKQVATVSVQRAHYLAERLTAISGVTRMFADKPFFNEFVIKLPQPVDQVLRRLESQGILGGIALGAQYPELADCLLVTCTEMTTPEHIECYAQAMASAMQSSTTTQKAMVLS